MPKTSRKKRALFAAIVLVAILGGAEAILRIHDFSFYYNFGADLLGMPLLDLHKIRRVQNQTVEFDPYLFWRFKPGQKLNAAGIYLKPVTINSMGFRGPEFEAQKPKHTYRVACIGDSTTFGWSVGDGDAFAFKLGPILQKQCAGKVESLNLGVTGYTSVQGRELMKRQVREWRPDLVVFAFGPNDRLPALMSDQEHLDSRTWEIGPVRVFLHRFQVYKLIKAGVVYMQNLSRGLNLDPRTYIPRLKRKVSMDEFAGNVREVKKICDRIGADLVLINVDYPSLPEDNVYQEIKRQAGAYAAKPPEDWRMWDGAALVASLGKELEIPALDLRKLFSENLSKIENSQLDPKRAENMRESMKTLIDGEPWRYLMIDNGHPNDWGHDLIAQELAKIAITLPSFKNRCEKGGPP